MKVTCLSGLINSPCYIVELEHLTVMFDCGLDLSSLYHFLPLPIVHSDHFSNLPSCNTCLDVKLVNDYPFVDADPEFAMAETNLIPFSCIDVILVSNCRSLLALPYITETLGFRGLVFATDPTINYGKLLMEELIDFVSAAPKHRSSTKWKMPPILEEVFPYISSVPTSWKSLYSKTNVENCIQKVKPVSFEEQVSLYGVATAIAYSSGLAIGSSNWLLKPSGSVEYKIAYLSGSSQFVTHCRPVDLSHLKNSDVVIISDVTNTPSCEPDVALKKFCDALIATLKVGGNVLIPCTPTGVIYDLLECLAGFLDSSGFATIPICFISPVAQSSLAHANIYSEWLNSMKQGKVYLPEPPFVHSSMIKNNSLFVYHHIHGRFSETYKSPSIIFTAILKPATHLVMGHPSLRFGPVVHFVELWAKSETNSIIFIEPDFSSIEAMKAFNEMNCRMKVYNCPIDTRLTYSQLSRILKDFSTSKVIMTKQMLKTVQQIKNADNQLQSGILEMGNITALDRAESCEVDDSSEMEQINVEHSLAKKCKLESLEVTQTEKSKSTSGSISSAMPIVGEFHLYNYQGTLRDVKLEGVPERQIPKPVLWGQMDVEMLIKELRLRGVVDVKVDRNVQTSKTSNKTEQMITIGKNAEDPDGMLVVGQDYTNVVGCKTEVLRKNVRDSIIACLKKL